jgi:hypothetical protein
MDAKPDETEMVTFDVPGGIPVGLIDVVYAVVGDYFDPQGNGWLGQDKLAQVEITLQYPAAKEMAMRPHFRGGPVCFVRITAPLSPEGAEKVLERIEARMSAEYGD